MLSDFLQSALFAALGAGLFYAHRIDRRLGENEEKLDALLRHFEVHKDVLEEPADRVKELARDPRFKVEAIKAYRQQTGAGLKEAKAIVEALVAERSP